MNGRTISRTFGRMLAAALVLLALAVPLFAADANLQEARDKLEKIRGVFDRIEATLARTGLGPRGLLELREEITAPRAELRDLIEKTEPRYGEIEARLKQLGAAPAPDKPAEAPEVATEREQQAAQFRDVDAVLRQAKLLAVRADQIAEKVDSQRRAAFTNQIFSRATSVFDPDLWLQAAAALPSEIEVMGQLLAGWRDHMWTRAGANNLLLAVFLSLLSIAAIVFFRNLVRRHVAVRPEGADAPPLTPAHRAMLALRDAILNAVSAPVAAIATLEIFTAFGLLPEHIRGVASGLVTAIIFFTIGTALAQTVLSPGDAARRLPALNDTAARRLHRLIYSAVLVTAVALFVNVVHRAMFSSVTLTVATSAIYALIIAILVGAKLAAGRTDNAEREDGDLPPWVRLIGWLAVSIITVALAAGYIRFASLVAERIVTAAVVILGLYLLLAVVDALFGEGLTRDSPRRRKVANTLGLRPKTLDLFATLFAGLLRAVLVLVAIFVVIGALSTTAIDLSATLDRATLTVQIGQTQISLADILAALAIFLIGILITRILYRWLSHTVLPRTDLDASLQNSIATIAGYTGFIIATSLTLARLGVNLENIALVAGALSIGIGFGLQAIVSNFVSGLILLTERPIRVGDWIVVKGEEGYVRKISVRSTEIETFDRASVILPNSDLITGAVKNWTHTDKLGRLSVAVSVSRDTDPERVREILLAVASEHQLVLKAPPPQVFFMRFSDNALHFELRAIVADVNRRLGVTSELHFEVFRRFREAKIVPPLPAPPPAAASPSINA